MIYFVIIAFVGLLFAVLLQILSSDKSKPVSQNVLPYEANESLLTDAERSFYEVLKNITSDAYHVFPQQKLATLVSVKKGTQNRQAHYNRISAKTVDFVLCNKTTLKPVLVIELDDASHNLEKRQQRDAFVDKVLSQCKIKILHIKAQASYPIQELQKAIQEKLKGGI